MRRREFLATSAAAAVGVFAPKPIFAAGSGSDRQLLELRSYHFASPTKQQAFESYLAAAGVAGFNRAGIKPVGVFKLLSADNPQLKLQQDSTDLWVLLPHPSMESVVSLESRLGADEQLQNAGREVLATPKSDPAFSRYDSTLLLAMEGFPRVQTPMKSESRVLQLRTYESHNQERAANKLAMFNAGEFEVFHQAGMPGVFFGGAVVGQNLPQLTYMVAHENRADVDKNWKAFFSAPGWKTLSSNPSYKDNVSKVINLLLRPAQGSQI